MNEPWTRDGTGNRTASERFRVLASVVSIALAALVVASAPTVAAGSSGPSPAMTVDLSADGDARMTLTLTYDLETEEQRVAFRSLENDSETRNDTLQRFVDRLAAVAADASNATGREMRVGSSAIDVYRNGSVGVVELSVTWTNLAAVQDGRLIVTEPFASGFETDRTVEVRGPEDYELVEATPTPDHASVRVVRWASGADLSGFRLTFGPGEESSTEQAMATETPTRSDDGTGTGGTDDAAATPTASDGTETVPTSGDTPGFGVLVAVLALLVVVVVRTRP